MTCNLSARFASHVVVLNFGRKIAEGTPERIREDPLVKEAYLGTERDGGTPCVLMFKICMCATAGCTRCAASRCNIESGEIVAVLGANGAGKSSLLKTVMGLQTASDGQVAARRQRHNELAARPSRAGGPCPGARGPADRHGPNGARESADGRLRAPRHA